MPLVAHSPLPTFDRLVGEGEHVLPLNRANDQDIRELHIGLLNMMPDSALQPTERQFMRLIGGSNRIAQFYVHPFTINGIERNKETQNYINQYYRSFDEIAADGLDALIITGANVPKSNFSDAPFWGELTTVLDFAKAKVTSTLCACLATHAALKYFYDIDRVKLDTKRWGVFPHRARRELHPLVRNVNTRFDVPHSRFNDIPARSFTEKSLPILVESSEAGVHLALSEDGFRFVFFQGHPEYDRNSLLKEYKREVLRFIKGELTHYPPLPTHYADHKAQEFARKFEKEVLGNPAAKALAASFPEEAMLTGIDNTWGDSARSIFHNWIGLVYQLTNLDRKRPFMEGIDPNDPLQIR